MKRPRPHFSGDNDNIIDDDIDLDFKGEDQREESEEHIQEEEEDQQLKHTKKQKFSLLKNNEWEPIRLPMDRILRNETLVTSDMESLLSNNTNIKYPSKYATNRYCFACSHVGENMAYIKGTDFEELMINFGTGLRTTEINQFCINISNQYNEIRTKVNNNLKTSKMAGILDELPEWTPVMVKEHLELHHNDPELTVELHMLRLKATIDFVWKEGLIEKKIQESTKKKKNRNDESDADEDSSVDIQGDTNTELKRVDPVQWKILKEMIETYIKLGKSRPETMAPYYKKGRFIVEERAKHPYFDSSTKNIYNVKYTNKKHNDYSY